MFEVVAEGTADETGAVEWEWLDAIEWADLAVEGDPWAEARTAYDADRAAADAFEMEGGA